VSQSWEEFDFDEFRAPLRLSILRTVRGQASARIWVIEVTMASRGMGPTFHSSPKRLFHRTSDRLHPLPESARE
jgi:hypothetical protein